MKTDFLILQRVLGRPRKKLVNHHTKQMLKKYIPCEKAPAKAFCSRGEIWYLVVPRTVTPRLPNPSPSLAREVLIVLLYTISEMSPGVNLFKAIN